MSSGNRAWWGLWLILSAGTGIFLTMQLTGEDKSVFLPGKTSNGHYQIELACSACHTDPLGGGEVLQQACMNCHGEELEVADDSHPKSKFTNPRNADRVKKLDARKCVTCHTEHREDITLEMGVTLPADFCFKCHSDVAENRPSHQGMAFTTCASAGCHNFHDNRGLYEDFLIKHLDEPDLHDELKLNPLSLADAYLATDSYPTERYPYRVLGDSEADRPESVRSDARIMQDWMDSSHRKAGVNCSACHEQRLDGEAAPVWVDRPGHQACSACHGGQATGFLAGKHGMRLAQNLPAMVPGQARSKMKKNVHEREVGCVSCHGAHRFERAHAAVDACLGCHDDQHSLAYKDSPHFDLWYRETNGLAEKNTGVSCATCHLPRKTVRLDGKDMVMAEHNQNDNLRPNEKMLRSVCMQCHGLRFSIDALADENLIGNNFSEKPGVYIESLDLVKKRLDLKKDIQDL